MNRELRLVAAWAASAVLATTAAVTKTTDPAPLTVHEWGTFTSVANADGTAATWQPLSGASDLPCFVEKIRLGVKGDVPGTVRMETPVLYFYAPQETTVDVSVRFHQGLVTEWFPRASVTPDVLNAGALNPPDVESRISWKRVRVRPGGSSAYPTGEDRSHYYAARETDASPLESGDDREKFLFYRGVGRFAPPLTATVRSGGTIDVTSAADQTIGSVVLFENRAGRIGFRAASGASARLAIDPPSLGNSDLVALQRELAALLVAQGLYAKEADAMIATWRDSWYEEGTRLFYIAPKRMVDAILPLQIDPTPVGVARVFVGRIELVTPRTMRDVKDAIDASDTDTFAKFERFMRPITARIGAEISPAERTLWDSRVKAAYDSYYKRRKPAPYCR
jgi:hypothetical protein